MPLSEVFVYNVDVKDWILVNLRFRCGKFCVPRGTYIKLLLFYRAIFVAGFITLSLLHGTCT